MHRMPLVAAVLLAVTTSLFAAAPEKPPKLSAELRELSAVRRAAATAGDATVQVVIESTADDVDAVKRHLQNAGGHFERSARGLVLARVPVASLEGLASADAVRMVRRPRAPVAFQTTSEGVSGSGAPAWHAAGRTGAGVKVAILDVGFSGYWYLMGTELPQIPEANIRSFSGDIAGGDEGHGTAVAEIVHDLAPQAELFLVNFSNEVELENAVDWLIEQRVHVINTSWGYPCGGPLDGSGFVNSLVERAANAGIVWVAAAGNFAQRHWSGTFNDSNGNAWHNFAAPEDANTVYLNSGEELRVCLEWDDWTNRNDDLDLYVWDGNGNILASSRENQSGPSTHEPWERLDFTAGSSADYFIGVRRAGGARTSRMHLFAYPPGAECAIEAATAAQPIAAGLLGELRQFRDTVLASTSAGRQWTRAYYRHSAEVRRILLRHPRLAFDAAALIRASRPAVRSVLDRTEAPFVLTGEYAARVDRFFAQLDEHAGPALRADLAEFRAAAALSASTGQTAAQWWDAFLRRDAGPQFERATYPDSGYMRHTVTATSLTPPSDSAHALTVGAIRWSTGAVEPFSSRGPTADGRRKPDLAAFDGVCTSTYAADCGGDGFLGTSAAAPHAAGAAALVRQVYPSLSVSGVRDFLTGRAVDVAPSGPDNDTGTGRLNLGATSDADVFPPPALIHPVNTTSPLSPGYGWHEVPGATGYRLMAAASRSALPADPGVSTCGACVVNQTTTNTFLTPEVPLSPRTAYHWQVQAFSASKNGAWAQASFTTLPPPQETPPDRDDIDEDGGRWSTPGRRAVVITHGWKSSAVETWVEAVARSMCAEVGVSDTTEVSANGLTRVCQGEEWDVWAMDWEAAASPWQLAWGAVRNAANLGEALAANLRLKNYRHIHFIAHSAGSNLIDVTTRRLRSWIGEEHRPSIEIHNTFLDAFEPLSDASRYGRSADWADNYVDTRPLDLGTGTHLDGTRLFMDHAYNVDVTPPSNVRPGIDPFCLISCRHSRPYRFYGRSVDDSLFKSESDNDPIDALGDVGYPLSLERGRTIASLKDTHRKGTKCVLRDGTCTNEAVSSTRRRPFVPIPATRKVASKSGKADVVTGSEALFDSMKLGPGPVSTAAATESPSWIVIDAVTSGEANVLRFDYRFADAGEGYLRIFVDGTLVRELDQRHVPLASTEAEEIYIGGGAGVLAPGAHRIVLRLDGFGANASGVELRNVDLGLIAPAARRRVIRH